MFTFYLSLTPLIIYFLPVTYPLGAIWHIRPQHNSANQLCQPLRFVPHSNSSIQPFPFPSPPSSSMLSLVCPVFVALLTSVHCSLKVFFARVHDTIDSVTSLRSFPCFAVRNSTAHNGKIKITLISS